MEFYNYFEGVVPAEAGILPRLFGCARCLKVHLFEDGRSFVRNVYFCGQPILCQVCSIRKGGSRLRKLMPALLGLVGGQGKRASMVTMTQRTESEKTAREMVLQMQAVWRAWWHASRQRVASCELRHVLGGFWQYELAYSYKHKAWHVHAHGVWIHDGWLDYGALRREYSDRVGYSAQLKIDLEAACKLRRDRPDVGHEEFDDVLLKSMLETIKYPLKFHGLEHEERLTAWEQLTGGARGGLRTRLCDSFGILRGVGDGVIKASDDGFGKGKFEELVFWYANRSYRLVTERQVAIAEVPF